MRKQGTEVSEPTPKNDFIRVLRAIRGTDFFSVFRANQIRKLVWPRMTRSTRIRLAGLHCWFS